MLLKSDADNYYEEYRGHVIVSSKNTGPDESEINGLTVYYKGDAPEYTFIVGADNTQNGLSKEFFTQLVNDARSYIDKCCCNDLNQGIEKSGTRLPVIDVAGTDFFVDVTRFQLIELFDSNNVIPFNKMEDYGDGYRFDYNKTLKNVPEYPDRPDLEFKMQEFILLDPAGIARKYNISIEEVKGKTDFDFMVDQKEFDLRVNQGRLPTIDIAGHLFYVDMRMDKLRPKDDFLSNGISFEDIDPYFSDERNTYLIPYDPKKHEFRELDYDNLLKIPKDLIAVALPFQQVLDPVGWNRKNGWDIKQDLKHLGLKGHFTAKVVDWKQTYIVDIINDNLERKKTIDEKKDIKIDKPKDKGRKM